LVGNQGGIRSAALLGFELEKQQFVATATAIGLFVDGARMPIYVATQHEELIQIWHRLGIPVDLRSVKEGDATLHRPADQRDHFLLSAGGP
jgi:hypothetical protein